ncbi:MAG TPA: glutamine synthetase III, partial [Flavobacteriaceae bacterium]|nr:glutamine synthetase III [Flavobacteriaceae bacterium]
MATIRFQALKDAQKHQPIEPKTSELRHSEIFAQNIFNKKTRRQFLPQESYEELEKAIQTGDKIDRNLADQISTAMKEWAISKGATHYTHWFQPLNGSSAEKHESFFHMDQDGTTLEKFSGGTLIQQESDASSFPSGGIRNTFEARGYSAWDPTSPAFIYGTNLCIPTIFVSYTGEALDYKTPLLRSLRTLNKHATAVTQYFDEEVNRVKATLGWEQEYFLIDSSLAKSRPDITMTGRTVFGHAPAKDQQTSGHYFGSIPKRVLQYMRDLELEARVLGIPVKTRHNEAAPNQFELAPIFEEANLAVDHNLLLMDIMNKVAERHNFKVLFHEKPFALVNGSGKHNNWSLATDTG